MLLSQELDIKAFDRRGGGVHRRERINNEKAGS